MVRKEDLCDWFKGLPAHKRVDYLCSLLHMCHPLELRFTGTVLEDLAKKDFHYLRDQEIKANQRADLSNNNSNSLSDQKLRAKIITALALMNSTNLPCAEIIFDILEQQFESMLGLLHNVVCAADLIMILTMAVHHPAFTFYQKDKLGQILERVEERMRELYGDDDDDERYLSLQSQTLNPETLMQPGCIHNNQSPASQPEKATVVSMEVVDAVPSQNRKGGAEEYKIRTTWSNKEVTEVLMKFKQIQELHHKILHRFPEEKKSHRCVPVFPGNYTHKEGTLEDKKKSLNAYFSNLAKAPAYILDCDILTEPLRNGTLVYQPRSCCTTHNTPSTALPTPHTQAVFSQTSPSRGDRKLDFQQYHSSIRTPLSNVVPHSHCSPGTSQLSSAANSPASSRTSSPAPLPGHMAGVKSGNLPPGSIRMNSAHGSDQILQLLRLLNLEDYYDSLKDYPFQQIMAMSEEEMAKAGLPSEAQAKLKSKQDQLKTADVNGLVDLSRLTPAETATTFYPPSYINAYHFLAPYAQFIHRSLYSGQPGQIALLQTPHPSVPANENSPANSETSSPPHSPLQPVAVIPHERNQGNGVNLVQAVPGPSQRLISEPTADASDGKLFNHYRSQQVESSGSEDDRTVGFGQEPGVLRGKGRGRPQQSRSLPQINQNTQSASAKEVAKLKGLPISVSAPHSHQVLLNVEHSHDSTPPLSGVSSVGAPHASANVAAVVNGYISDPPIVPPPGVPSVVPRAALNSRTFKTAQPAHTNLVVHKNVMNMPPDIPHPVQNLGKNGASTSSLPILHGSLPPQSYSVGPSIASVPPAQVMGLSPMGFPANNFQLGPQPSPTQPLMPDGNSTYMVMYPRGILTTIANTTAIMPTTQSHHTVPPISHSPSPAATAICADQLQTAPYVAETLDANRCEGSRQTPPVQTTPVHTGAVHAQAGGTNSNTPSPPLVSSTSKQQVGTNDTQPGGRGTLYFNINNTYPIIYTQQGHHQLPHFPNGITSDYAGWPRYPQQLASNPHIPFMYGSIFSHPSLSGTLHPPPGSNGPAASSNHSHTSGGLSGKNRCYNCGGTGHKASDCKEIRMENMSNTFHLSYKPTDPPA